MPIALLLLLAASLAANAALYERGKQLLICDRTANRDAPENILEPIRDVHQAPAQAG
jgi:hypothetical protein